MPTRYQVQEGDNISVEPLGQPLTFHFSQRTAKNRFLKAAMAEGLATWSPTELEERGIPTPELVELYRRWGEDAQGWGVILTGNVAIDFEHMSGAGMTVITPESPFSGRRFEAFQAMAAAGKANGSLMVAQVVHPGRQAPETLTKEPFSASAVPLAPKMGHTFAMPHAASLAEIQRVITGYGHAAEYLERAGFDGIELHGAHGYLIAQFLARRTNQRTDAYGGSLENRMRLLLEIAQEVRRRTSPAFIVGAKINSVEFQDGGITPDEARDMCALLRAEDVALDFVELSGGTYEKIGQSWADDVKESTRRREAFFFEFAQTVVPAFGVEPADRTTKVYLTGGLRTAPAMVRALDVVDGVGLGKPAAAEPGLAAALLDGSLSGAIRPVDQIAHDDGLSLIAACVQFRQITQGYEPFDLSDPTATATFLSDIGALFQRRAKDTDQKESGVCNFSGPQTKHISAA
ncbi:NADH oxidase [Grosmannia clavigera kw1407]|uniref:NADH oxidase n=1 Tax=Grosmannia clavigera (strain kw1407 / UAMH 11150) TaxID=655863 RepID=F0X8R1_GROCL|nr:NADH oxidase [Grosmannia clavigera kw1407]EFX05325.1 NADH oxidase [Grosmannia clavigera kw1407]